MFENLRVDFARAREDRSVIFQGGSIKQSVFLQNLRILLALTTWSVLSYRFSHWVGGLRIPVVKQVLQLCAILLQRWAELWTGIYIHSGAQIGPGLLIHTPYGICVGPTRIGSNLTIGTGVLIAGGSRGVGNDVYFGPGAKLIGNAKIGNNVVVVANSVVLTDVPDNTTIMGVPARIRLPGGQPKRFLRAVPARKPETAVAKP
jgi:serine O-acetyltransferase